MTVVYIILILLQLGVVIFFIRQGRMQKKQLAEKQRAATQADTYEGVRSLALNVTPFQLKLAIPSTETLVYGVIMDWQMGEAVTTLAAYITGATSLCFSTGGIVKGGGINANVGEAAVEFVIICQNYIDRAIPVSTTDLPAKGCVRFYFLTNKGMFGAQEHVRYFDDMSSPWLNLFVKGNIVINEIQGVVN